MSAPRLTARQYEMLAIFARKKCPCEWGEIWDSYSFGDEPSPLQMSNFTRVGDALLKRGLLTYDATDGALISITDAGRAELARRKEQADRIRALHCISCSDVMTGKPKTDPCHCACHGGAT